ncbi:hypothetical protein C8J56DRAFT_940764 [Mycena floridula]|nr:hypothetical protein C8J56DRAFT_940764 [Mycena floridula]
MPTMGSVKAIGLKAQDPKSHLKQPEKKSAARAIRKVDEIVVNDNASSSSSLSSLSTLSALSTLSSLSDDDSEMILTPSGSFRDYSPEIAEDDEADQQRLHATYVAALRAECDSHGLSNWTEYPDGSRRLILHNTPAELEEFKRWKDRRLQTTYVSQYRDEKSQWATDIEDPSNDVDMVDPSDVEEAAEVEATLLYGSVPPGVFHRNRLQGIRLAEANFRAAGLPFSSHRQNDRQAFKGPSLQIQPSPYEIGRQPLVNEPTMIFQ